jgi:hypothetical protein
VQQKHCRLIFGSCASWVLINPPVIRSDTFRGFPQSLQESASIAPQSAQERYFKIWQNCKIDQREEVHVDDYDDDSDGDDADDNDDGDDCDTLFLLFYAKYSE